MPATITSTKLIITREDSVRVLTVTPVGLMGPPGPCGGLLIDVSGGILGVCGSTGINVSSPVQGTQFISLDLSDPGLVEPYSPSSHTAFTSLSADSGTARKVAFLQSDGGITFDYIRNYDVFKQNEFLLQINSFTFNVGPNILIGSSGNLYTLNGAIATASYSKTVNSAIIEINIAQQVGFPQTLTAPFTSYTFNNDDLFEYPLSVGGTRVFTLTAVGDTNTATATYTLTFINNLYYAASSNSSATVSQIRSAGTTVLSNSKARTFTITANAVPAEYIYYSYPSRLGTATFTVNGFAGGFSLISTESHTNPAGYAENYYVYRSDNPGLGTTTVTVS